MVSTAFKGGAILLMIFCGAINTVDYKFQNTQLIYEGPMYKYFFHPYMQTLLMFFSQFMCLPVYLLWKRKNPQELKKRQEQAKQQGKLIKMNKLYIAIPAFFDLLSSTMQFMALNFIPASAYQMMRGGVIITTFLFSVLLAKQKVIREQLLGTGSALVGILIVGGVNTIYSTNSDESNGFLEIVGYLLIVVSLFTNGLFFVFQQKLMAKYYLQPLQVVGFEGLFGFIAYLGIVPALCYIPCSFGKDACVYSPEGFSYMQGLTPFLNSVFQNYFLLVLILFSVVTIMIYNAAGVTITKYINALARAIADVTKTIVVWVVSAIITAILSSDYPNYKWQVLDGTIIGVQIVGFAFLVMGNLIYNKLVPLPKCLQPKTIEPLLDKDD